MFLRVGSRSKQQEGYFLVTQGCKLVDSHVVRTTCVCIVASDEGKVGVEDDSTVDVLVRLIGDMEVVFPEIIRV